MLVTTVAGAAVAALAGSPHCVGMCGPLACAAGPAIDAQIAYHLGRVGTYVVLGTLAGAVGQVAPVPGPIATGVAAVVLFGFALSIAGVLPAPHSLPGFQGLARLGARFARGRTVGSRLLFGIANGLLPCGLLYATLALPLASADAVVGAVTMAVFGLLTMPALAAATFGLRALLRRRPAFRKGLAAVVLVTGLFTLGLRDGWFTRADEPAPVCHVPR